jgi:hypothetical protein
MPEMASFWEGDRMARKTGKTPPPSLESYIFEIADFRPSYSLSVEHRKYEKRPWWEHTEIEFDSRCIFPEKLAGRTATFDLVADRNFWTPYAWQKDKDWRPACVGCLELSPSHGRFYCPIAFDSLPGLLTAMAHGLYRYVLVYGPPLKRGKSLCNNLQFMRTVDLDDY